MAALENRGPALVDAGAGNDNVFVSRSDDADTRAKGGISTCTPAAATTRCT